MLLKKNAWNRGNLFRSHYNHAFFFHEEKQFVNISKCPYEECLSEEKDYQKIKWKEYRSSLHKLNCSSITIQCRSAKNSVKVKSVMAGRIYETFK